MEFLHRQRLLFFSLFFCALAIIFAPKVAASVQDPANDQDINIRKRDWTGPLTLPLTPPRRGGKELIDIQHPEDPIGPELSTLFDPMRPDPSKSLPDPEIVNIYHVNNYNGGGTPGPESDVSISNDGVSMIDVNPWGSTVLAPQQGYDIGGGYSWVILYIDPANGDITINDTNGSKGVASGYTLHLFGINVNQQLIDLYNQGKKENKLVYIACKQNLGTPKGLVKLTIRDSGSFMDPRWRQDWWHEPASCNSNLPPTLFPAGKNALPPYFEYNIQRAKPDTLLDSFNKYYSVACMPEEDFHIGYENNDKCNNNPNYSCPDGWDKNWNVNGSLGIDVNNKIFGLFRDEKTVTARQSSGAFPARRESIEGYLSAKNLWQPSSSKTDFLATNTQPSVSDVTDTSVNQAPLYKLTTLEEQCSFAMQKLQAVQQLCDASRRIEGQAGDPCGLDQKIPNTPYYHIDLLNAIGSRTCPDLMDPAKTDTQTLKLRQAILSVNPAMETAYRPAFIVAVTTFDGTDALNKPEQNIAVNTGTTSDKSTPFTVVDYLEVKVPAFASDFLPDNGTNQQADAYRDPLMRTADILRTTEERNLAASEEKTIRNKIIQNSQNLNGPKVIGNDSNIPVLCYDNGSLVSCDPSKPDAATNNIDKLPPTLIKFINANTSVDTGAASGYPGLPCDRIDEKDFFNKNFYSDATKKRIAEQARTIGADLQAQDFPAKTEEILKVKRKKDIQINLSVNIKKIPDTTPPATHTRLYFVSPYNYNLKYAQQSFLNFLTQDQQKYLESLGLGSVNTTTQQFALNPQKFSPLSKNPIGDKLDGSSVNGHATHTETVTQDVLGHIVTYKKNTVVDLIGKLLPNSDDVGQDKSHSILLELAGQVASLPTRLMALVTTPPHSPTNDEALACAGKNGNNYATEDWLKKNCGKNQQTNTNYGNTANGSGSLDFDPNQQFTNSGNMSNTCVEVRIDHDRAVSYGQALKDYLALPANQKYWAFDWYKPGGTQYMYTSCEIGSPCYAEVIDKAVENNINPYLAIAIAFNESGGLKTDDPSGKGPFFGCGIDVSNYTPGHAHVLYDSISNKLDCMVNTFKKFTDADKGNLDSNLAMWHYGYQNGYRTFAINDIIQQISSHTYKGNCNALNNDSGTPGSGTSGTAGQDYPGNSKLNDPLQFLQ